MSGEGVTCPECGKTFKNERGLKLHMARVHGIKSGGKKEEKGVPLDQWM